MLHVPLPQAQFLDAAALVGTAYSNSTCLSRMGISSAGSDARITLEELVPRVVEKDQYPVIDVVHT